MTGYYDEQLAAERLRQCYDIAPPRVQQYLQAEIDHLADRIRPSDAVLELGCGYGRVLEPLATRCRMLVGIDTSPASLKLAARLLREHGNCLLVRMDAARMGFCDDAFDVVACVQNGISAFQVDQRMLIAEAVRVTRPGGRVLFSSYSERFWDARLDWFRLQAAHGLVGEIDEQATGDGVIVCKDGFRATTVSVDRFRSLTAGLGARVTIEEVDVSSVFCEIVV